MVRPGYQTYLEFQALRGQIENRLPSARLLILHAGLFLLFTLFVFYDVASYRYMLPLDWMRVAHTVWSFVLCIHALAVYSRSGAARRVRQRAIDGAMRERLDADPEFDADDELLFELHYLLDRDTARRAHSAFIPLVAFAILNALGSIYALSFGAPVMFWVSLFIVMFISGPLAIALSWSSRRRDAALLRRFSPESAEPLKRKREEAVGAEAEKPKRRPGRAALRSPDGETLEVIDVDPDHDGELWDARFDRRRRG